MVAEPSALAELYRRSTSKNPALRVGIMLDSPHLLACFARVVDDIRASNFADLTLLIYNGTTVASSAQPGAAKRSLFGKVVRLLGTKSIRQKIAYERYLAWDSQRNAEAANPLASLDYSDRLSNVPSITVTPLSQKFTHRFAPEDVATIRSHNLDVILRFGFNIIRGDILTSARYGVWSFHHGDNDDYRGGPPHFWELVERHPHTGVILQVLSDELDAGFVLAKGLFATQHGLSLTRNRFAPYWGTTHFVIQKLYELHMHGWEFVKSRAVPDSPYRGKQKIYRAPTNWQMARWLGTTVVSRGARRNATDVEWKIGLRRAPRPLFAESGVDLREVSWLEAPRGHYYADPVLFSHNETAWLFAEDFVYERGQAHIAVAPVSADGSVGAFTPCLTRPYHLSYPHVFAADGEIFMVPESGKNRTVELYRATRFPHEWTLEKVLLPYRAVDSTVVRHAGRWWMFTTLTEPAGVGSFCQLFSAPTLTGEWELHPSSPVSATVEAGRGAGPIVHHEGRMFRPTQSCCPVYGYSFSFQEITALDAHRYHERTVATIEPRGHRSLVGMHSYTRLGDLEAIDGSWAVDVKTRR